MQCDLADFNRDGRMDLVWARRGSGTADFYLNTGEREASGMPIFTPAGSVPISGWEAVRAVALNGDGVCDLVVNGQYTKNLNPAGWPFKPDKPVTLDAGREPCFVDLDGDGRPDAVCLCGKTPPRLQGEGVVPPWLDNIRVGWRRNLGGDPPKFGPAQTLPGVDVRCCTSVAAAHEAGKTFLVVQHDFFQRIAIFELVSAAGAAPRFAQRGEAKSKSAVLALGDQAWPCDYPRRSQEQRPAWHRHDVRHTEAVRGDQVASSTMTTITGTPLLRLLRHRRLLQDRLQWLGIREEQTAQWLAALDGHRTLSAAAPSASVLKMLHQHGLVRYCDGCQAKPATNTRRKPSLAFLGAVNLELTYDCNRDCGHCLQQGIRKRLRGGWLPTAVGKQVLRDAWFAGVASTGVNFTGGEVFASQSNLPELVKAARSLGVNVRINTNGWWGDRENIRLGKLMFQSAGHLIGWLRETGVAILALSYDRRYADRPDAWPPVVVIVRECERQGQDYQFVCTGEGAAGASSLCDELVRRARVSPRHCVPMEMIDIGGASGPITKPLRSESVAEAVDQSPCGGRGFFMPHTLHIAPDGAFAVACMHQEADGWGM
jgi:hypothetical protein